MVAIIFSSTVQLSNIENKPLDRIQYSIQNNIIWYWIPLIQLLEREREREKERYREREKDIYIERAKERENEKEQKNK